MQGSFGVVTIHEINNQKVAFKRFKEKCRENDFEVEVASALQGPHFPTFLQKIEPREDAPHGGFIQQYTGSTLTSYVCQSRGKIQKNILKQIYDAITSFHCHGLIHRDIKFHNMTIDNGVVYLIDFGLSCYQDSEENKGHCGSLMYLPIAGHTGEKRTFASDLESLGYCILQLHSIRLEQVPLQDLLKYKRDFIYKNKYSEREFFSKIQKFLRLTLNPEATEDQLLNALLDLGV